MGSKAMTAVRIGVGTGLQGASAAAEPARTSSFSMSPTLARTFVAPSLPRQLALTFDDGPNPRWTARLLEILAEHSVLATFFMLGAFAQAEPALVRRVIEAGHLIANHSWSHPNLAQSSVSRVRDELERTNDVLAQITGQPVRFFRPPYGARRPVVLCIARELTLTPVTWNAMTKDWSDPSAAHIVAELAEQISSNTLCGRASNIVLHDGDHRSLYGERGPSVLAAGQILSRYECTHHFVALDSWLPSAGHSIG